MAARFASQHEFCDTLPAAKLADPTSSSRSPSPPPTSTTFEVPTLAAEDVPAKWELKPESVVEEHDREIVVEAPVQPPARKLCVRHQRMADEGTNLKLQQALDALPVEERESVNAIWSNFSSSPHPRRELILRGILTMCCFSQLSLLTDQLNQLIRIDPFAAFPREVSLKILAHLDATSLCRAAQVSRRWRGLADDDILWRGICEQHIGTKCQKCGWGLPVLERRRTAVFPSASPSPGPSATLVASSSKRKLEDDHSPPAVKRQRSEAGAVDLSPLLVSPRRTPTNTPVPSHLSRPASLSRSDSLTDPALLQRPISLSAPVPSSTCVTRPWKDVYSERLKIERNWRRGRCSVRILKGHTDGVMCLQFSETMTHPAFPILITGSYDRTARVWNIETGEEILAMKGHTRAVRALQFDEVKLVTGSMDHTLKVWNWRTGKCIRTLEGHTEGVICLNFDRNVLASGSIDTTVKVWNFRNGECFTLRGHRDWVNAVQLWDTTPSSDAVSAAQAALSSSSATPSVDPGKMLFSASDDGTIRLWDLTLRTCVRQFLGHMGQVQSMKLMNVDAGHGDAAPPVLPPNHPGYQAIQDSMREGSESPRTAETATLLSADGASAQPMLLSGSLDNTVKMWDIESGKVVRTMFGHIEGVWAVACDKMRLVSGSHDRTIKVWCREDGQCVATLVGHTGAVTCLALGEDTIVSGSDDGDVRIWCFANP